MNDELRILTNRWFEVAKQFNKQEKGYMIQLFVDFYVLRIIVYGDARDRMFCIAYRKELLNKTRTNIYKQYKDFCNRLREE